VADGPGSQPGSFVLRCGCGSRITTAVPLAKDASYVCASCCSSTKERSRLKRRRDEEKNAALRRRLEAFLNLPLKGHEAEWFELAQELKVDAVALEAVVAVVQEAKWQQSTAPLMFVRVNVERRSEQWQDPFGEDGRLKRAQIFSQNPDRADVAWLRLWVEMREQNARVTPDDIVAASRTLSVVENEEERGVLCARALGLTRAQYLSGVSDVERRKRGAAWKRLNRHGLPDELRLALKRRSGFGIIVRRGFEDRAWRDSSDGLTSELPSKPTQAQRFDYEDEDWRTRRVVHSARR
jgi:hypothetical protein